MQTTTEIRDLNKVIDRILEILPTSSYLPLRHGLKKVQQKIQYSSPEMQPHNWKMASLLLQYNLGRGKPSGGWKLQIHKVFVGEE